MTEFRQYLLSVISASIVCAVVPILGGNDRKKILRLICGVFLTVSVVAPVLKMDLNPILDDVFSDQEARQISQQGKQQAYDAVGTIIIRETQAYILDKARLLGLELKVTVQLESDEFPIPAAVILQGTANQDQKSQLEKIITEDLGIPKEAQQWISG